MACLMFSKNCLTLSCVVVEGDGGKFYTPAGFPQRLQPWHFAEFSKILLEMFVPNVVFFTSSSLQVLGKTQTWVFPISGFLVNPSKKEIVITPEPVMILT